MPDDYYPPMDGGEDKSEPTKAAADSGDDTEATALIPKSLLAGKEFKPGEEVVLKIVHIYEDEVEVEYAKEPSKEDEGGQSEHMMSADKELRGMAAMNEGS